MIATARAHRRRTGPCFAVSAALLVVAGCSDDEPTPSASGASASSAGSGGAGAAGGGSNTAGPGGTGAASVGGGGSGGTRGCVGDDDCLPHESCDRQQANGTCTCAVAMEGMVGCPPM